MFTSFGLRAAISRNTLYTTYKAPSTIQLNRYKSKKSKKNSNSNKNDKNDEIEWDFSISDVKESLNSYLSSLGNSLSKIRTGGAAANIRMIEDLIIETPDSKKRPLKALASVSVLGSNSLRLSLFDSSFSANPILRHLSSDELGLNGQLEGNSISINIPKLSEEHRNKLVKRIHERGEETRISMRKVRKDIMDRLKKAEKSFGKDEVKRFEKLVSKEMDSFDKQIDSFLKKKEKELLK